MKPSKRHSRSRWACWAPARGWNISRLVAWAMLCLELSFQSGFWPNGVNFAAGNRTIMKPSEYTVESALLTKELCDQYFSEDEVAVVLGGPETGATFSRMPFDHLLFTGATAIASHVMRAAAENLVPVTLELGGKSPVLYLTQRI